MTNKNDDASLVDIALALKVHSCDKRADCVQDRKATRLGIILDGARHPVRAENRHCARRNLGKVLHEARALGLEALHYVTVMDDLMAHINRRSELFSARSTISMARTTPAQNPLGCANMIFIGRISPSQLAGCRGMQSRCFFVTLFLRKNRGTWRLGWSASIEVVTNSKATMKDRVSFPKGVVTSIQRVSPGSKSSPCIQWSTATRPV